MEITESKRIVYQNRGESVVGTTDASPLQESLSFPKRRSGNLTFKQSWALREFFNVATTQQCIKASVKNLNKKYSSLGVKIEFRHHMRGNATGDYLVAKNLCHIVATVDACAQLSFYVA